MQTPIPMPKPKPDSNDPNYRDPFPNNSNDNNNGDNNKQPNQQKDDIQPTKFEYDNIVYKIDKEDNIDYKKVYYADLVLKNNAEGFKKLLPNVETYQNFKELNGEKDIPTFAAASYYIRNLEHYLNNSFIKDNATNKKEINPLEYNTLVRKILQILKDTKFSEEFNVTKTIPEQAKTTKDKIFRFLMPHINIW
ncbi:Uncharacterised protein, partial [Metamycoplasma alkalescens]